MVTQNKIHEKVFKFHELVKKNGVKLQNTAENPYQKYTYMPLDTLLKAIDPLLIEAKLIFTSSLEYDNGITFMRGELIDLDSSERLESVLPLSLLLPTFSEEIEYVKDAKKSLINRPQTLGSIITYMRRYMICSLLNIVSDSDLDGTIPGQKPDKTPAPNKNTTKPNGNSNGSGNGRKASKSQIGTIQGLIKRKVPDKLIDGWKNTNILVAFSISHIEELKIGDASALIKKLMEKPDLPKEEKKAEEAKDEKKETAAEENNTTTNKLSNTQLTEICYIINALDIPDGLVKKLCLDPNGVESLEDLTEAQAEAVIKLLRDQAPEGKDL